MGMLVYYLFIRLYLIPHGRRAFGTRTHYFPRGMGASIVPFGRDSQKIRSDDRLIVQPNSSVSQIWLTKPYWMISRRQRGTDMRVSFERNTKLFLQRPLLQGRPSIQEAKRRGQSLSL
jgi:hypothetical protein